MKRTLEIVACACLVPVLLVLLVVLGLPSWLCMKATLIVCWLADKAYEQPWLTVSARR